MSQADSFVLRTPESPLLTPFIQKQMMQRNYTIEGRGAYGFLLDRGVEIPAFPFKKRGEGVC